MANRAGDLEGGFSPKEEKLPQSIMEEYLKGISIKNNIGERGLFEQSKMNERFFIGDQWHGANCGNDRPLVRHNILKRIGEYKIAVVGGGDIRVKFSAEGIPISENSSEFLEIFKGRDETRHLDNDVMKQFALQGMSNYFSSSADRVDFNSIKDKVLRDSYVSGTGLVYTFWDNSVETGLFADKAGEFPIRGDIACEVIDVENVYFGSPEIDDVQKQAYIIIAQKCSVSQVREEARFFGAAEHIVSKIVSDSQSYPVGNPYAFGNKPESDGKVTVLTKFWKAIDDESGEKFVYAAKVCNGVSVRTAWCLGIRLYPFAKFSWESRRNLIYGNSEISNLIPNQIAINRMATANAWAVMMMGMPIMLVNGELIDQDITNDPGQVIQVFGEREDVSSAIKFVEPPSFSPEFNRNIKSLIDNTLGLAGANDALLGDLSPNNTSAILAVREAALVPLERVQLRFRSFCEDVARVWAEFWVTHYGARKLKITDGEGAWYMPFDGDRYRHLVLSAKVQVATALPWNYKDSVEILNMLYDRAIIDREQYISRLPVGLVDSVQDLINDGNEA